MELIENVQIHGYHLMLDAGRALTREEIAGDWYDRVYRPSVEAIRAENPQELHPEATESDFFLCVYYRRRELYPEVGCVPLTETAQRMAEDARRGRGRLNRILRPAAA